MWLYHYQSFVYLLRKKEGYAYDKMVQDVFHLLRTMLVLGLRVCPSSYFPKVSVGMPAFFFVLVEPCVILVLFSMYYTPNLVS
jgi:hypothetical protein